ncbi:MAG: FAD-binding protein [Desulfobacteraceae bacterium]|nr:MAG: FAD-binding protein [Desulfobacteraceae bacterium]
MADPLFEPITINSLSIKNRIYLPAMHLGMAVNFEVTDQITAFYADRAKGGAGMICVGYATVDDLSGNTQNIGAHDDRFIPGLKRLSDAIKTNGSRSCVQINHAGRYNFSFFLDGKQPVAPSPIASRMTHEVPKEMTLDEIKQTVQSFGGAALRVKQAGFDAVEVLSGTGYLISEFLSPLTNQRTDEYGGSLENRMRFGLEVMDAVRQAVGPDFPLIVRMNGNDFMPGGNTREELLEYAEALSRGPVDALCINVGWHEARVPQIVTCVPRGAFSYLARGMKERVEVPVIASHRINDPEIAREMIDNDQCDMVAMGRSLITDPMLPEKARTGREEEIIHCIACAQGCFDNLFRLKHVECLCNPRAGYEHQPLPEAVQTPLNVMVIGAGPAGMVAATTLHDRGHHVTIYEKSGRMGGQLNLAGSPPGREEFLQFSRDLERQVHSRRIPVLLNREATESDIQAFKPDHVILAAGARALVPPIDGIDLPHVVNAWDVLEKKARVGKKVIVIGGGAVGVETALFLSEKGTLSPDMVKFLLVNKAEPADSLFDMATRGSKEILVVEMMDKIGKDIGKSTKWGMMQDLGRFGVQTLTGAKVVRITPGGLEIEQDGNNETLKADTVVLAAGSAPNRELEETVRSLDIPVSVIGDAQQIATAFDAVHSAYKAGLSV